MENDMASRQPHPPINPPNVGSIAIIIAILLFIIGLVVYISSFGPMSSEESSSQDVTNAPSAGTTPKATRVEGQVIVKFKPGVTDAQITNRLSPLHASIKSQIEEIKATVITVPPGQEDAILKDLANDPLVQYAEPDYIYQLEFSPNDTDFSKQWGLVNTGQTVNNKPGKADADIDADLAWDVSKGTGVKVAILDSGLDVNHPELGSKVVLSKGFSTTTIIDENGHGTHVAGILAANTNNGQGIAGVCPDCQLIIGKIANAEGSVEGSAIAASITWAADSGAQVINMSIAGPSFSQAVQDSVNYAWGKNVVIVAAAGNTGLTAKNYPAAYANVVSVANTNSSDAKRSDSAYGTWVQIAAPGDNIYSTLPTTPSHMSGINFGYLSGTSMASPVVAGVAALVWKTQYGTNNAAVVQRLYSTADKIAGTGTNWVSGRVNAAAAVGANANPSAAPSTGPAPTSSPNPISVVPTFVCGGSTNSICPIPSTTGTVIPSGNKPAPTTSGTTQPVSPVPSGSVTQPEPCTGTVSIAHNKKSKHKKRSQGGVNKFVNWLLKFFIELINLILKLIGGGQIPVPTNPGDPGNPCVPPVGPSVTPSLAPTSANQPSSAMPSLTTSLPAPSVPANTVCSNPAWTSADPNGMWDNNGFFIHNNMWNNSAGPQTTYACAYNNWYVTSTQTNSAGAVKTYPNVHKDFNKPLNSFTTITSTYAHTTPSINGIWNVAYDIWLNSLDIEVMIWTDNKNQVPSGTKISTQTFGGKSYDVWKTSNNSYIAFVQQPAATSGTVNIREMLDWLISQGWLTANVELYQIDYGVEIVSTNGTPETFKFTNFSLTAN
jgi:thermitase